MPPTEDTGKHSAGSTPAGPAVAGSEQGAPDRLPSRLDYAWKWFQHHATQRTTLFNYFLVISGILATAYVNLLKEGYCYLGAGLGLLGVLISVGFHYLDCRNRELVRFGEDVLRRLEEETLFPDRVEDGILRRDHALDEQYGRSRDLLKHRFWIRGTELSVGVLFLILGVTAVGVGLRPRPSDDLAAQVRSLQAEVTTMREQQNALLLQLGRLEVQLRQTPTGRGRIRGSRSPR